MGGASIFFQVYQDFYGKVRGAILSLIYQERDREQIGKALLKIIFQMDKAAAITSAATAFYSQKASKWIQEYTCPEYLLKVEEWLELEKEKVSSHLHSSTELEIMQHELLSVRAFQLLWTEDSGSYALFRDNKGDDLSRMYRLFCNIPQALQLLSDVFNQHVTSEGIKIVKEPQASAMNLQLYGPEYNSGTWANSNRVIKDLIELHDQYLAYVNNHFQNHSLFHKAGKEAFEVFCDQYVTGRSCAEPLAGFCDNILKKAGRGELSDEAIEAILEKVVKLIAYISDKDLFAEFYRKMLARRLLLDESDNNHERSILAKLKQQCGRQFTLNMEWMLPSNFVADGQKNFELWKTKKLMYDVKAASTKRGMIDCLEIVMPPGKVLSDVTGDPKFRRHPQFSLCVALQNLGFIETETVHPSGVLIRCYLGEEMMIFDSYKCVGSSIQTVRNVLDLSEVLEVESCIGLIVVGRTETFFAKLFGNNLNWDEVKWSGGRVDEFSLEDVESVAKQANSFYITKTGEPTVSGLILAGRGDSPTQLSACLDFSLQALVLNHVQAWLGGKFDLYEAIRNSERILPNMRFVKERQLLERFSDLARDQGNCVYGINDTLKALEKHAVGTLILFENLNISRFKLKNSITNEVVIKYLTKEQESDDRNFCEEGDKAELEVQERNLLIEWLYKEHGHCVEFEFVNDTSAKGDMFYRGCEGIGGFLISEFHLRSVNASVEDNESLESEYQTDDEDFNSLFVSSVEDAEYAE